MDPGVLSALILGALALAGTYITNRQNRIGAKATTALTERVVDREDFDSVMGRMKEQLDRADKRISELETRLEVEVDARERAEQRAERAEKRAAALERRVTQLEEVLRQHNIPVPPPPAPEPEPSPDD